MLAVDRVLALVKAHHGLSIRLEGRCPGGEVGAYFAQMPDGKQVVVKWSESPQREARIRAAVDALSSLRMSGYPVPAYGPVLPFDGGVLIAQERVSGSWSDTISDALGQEILDCTNKTIGRGTPIDDEPWGEFILRTLCEGADGWALHQPLRDHSADTRDILGWIEATGAGTSLAAFHQRDLVHLDYHHRNVLQASDGDLVAIVDMEGVRQGDSALDIVTFAFGLTVADCSVLLAEGAWERAMLSTNPDALQAYVAHMALRRLDWTIRFHPDEVAATITSCLDARRRVS